jgi:hypothetical protein
MDFINTNSNRESILQEDISKTNTIEFDNKSIDKFTFQQIERFLQQQVRLLIFLLSIKF